MTSLEGAVREAYGATASVVSCTPSAYATSHPVADVVVRTGDGREVTLLHKDVATFLPGADAAKPSFLRDARREPLVYRELLSRVDVGAPRLIGTGDGWLLLEKVQGVELYQVGDLDVWRTVAGDVAAMHGVLGAALEPAGAVRSLRLVRHDAPAIDRWMARAHAALSGSAWQRWSSALGARYGQVRDRILSLPQTIIHGELYASNVLVSGFTAPVERVCPIDWEVAAVGPGLFDLAALVAGRWSDHERRTITAGYLDVSPLLDPDDLEVCRLHLAVQWLGWSSGWVAPPEHAHDWLTEARELSERLGLT